MLRIKERDYYATIADRPDGADASSFGLTITMSDLGYAGLFAVCFLDFQRRYYHQVDTLSVLPLGRAGFSRDSGPRSASCNHRNWKA